MSVRALNLLKVALLTSLVVAGCSADTGSRGMPTSPVIIPSTATALFKPPTSRPATSRQHRDLQPWLHLV